jgi:multiple sugar transport system substrate-binding protein
VKKREPTLKHHLNPRWQETQRKVRGDRRATAPEGPYESGQQLGAAVANQDMGCFIDLMEQLESEIDQSLPLKSGYREMRMVLHLMRNHLNGRLVTSTALAASSGLSYGTAMRAIKDLRRRGLIVKRSRTVTGKSFSLHPSATLLARWQEYARRSRILLASSMSFDEPESAELDHSSSSLSAPSRIVPPPAVLEAKLALGRSIRFLVHADPTFTAMNALRKQFEMVLGVEIKSRALSIDRLRAEIIENSLLATSRYDIIACDLPWFGEMASRGRLLPLDSLIAATDFDRSDFPPEALASTSYKGAQYGIPILVTAETLVYRTDLFAAAGLAPPATIGKTLAAARALHNPATGMSGIAWNGGRGTPVGHTFIMIMGASFGQPVVNLRRTGNGFDASRVDGEEMRPMFLTDAARETAEYLLELVGYSPPDILRMAWYDRAATYAQGKAAMAYSHSLLAPLFELSEASPAFRRTGHLPHPQGPRSAPIAPLGGYALCIPANVEPDRIAPVWAALCALTSPSAAKLYMTNGSLACPRFSVSNDPEVRALSPMIAAVEEMARRGVTRMWPRPPIPEISEIIAIVGEEIHDALGGAKAIPQALTEAQDRVDALMRSRGYY